MIGKKLQQYKIVEEISVGGMGAVYLGVHTKLDRKVAIKSLNSMALDQPEIISRFRNEAITLGKLKHANIVTLYDYIERPNGVYLVLEYVEGETLEEYIDRHGALEEEEALPLFLQILEAIHFAHQQGIIHRDLKPSNFMVNKYNKIKILDFGIAKPERTNARITQTGMKVGTTMFMSPEQVKGKLVDRRSDIYALGVTLYRMLTGELPYDDDLSEFEISVKIVNERFPNPKLINEEISNRLVKAIAKATSKKPYERYQSCKDFAEDISGTNLPFPFNLAAVLSQKQTERIKVPLFNSKFWRNLMLVIVGISFSAAMAWGVMHDNKLMHVTQNDLVLYRENNDQAEAIARLNYGETVRLLDDNFWGSQRGPWLKVRTQYGEEGFLPDNTLMDTESFELINSVLANREARFRTDVYEKRALLQYVLREAMYEANQATWQLRLSTEPSPYGKLARADLDNDSLADFTCVLKHREYEYYQLVILFRNGKHNLSLSFNEPIEIKAIVAGRKGGKWFTGQYKTMDSEQYPLFESLNTDGLLIVKTENQEKNLFLYHTLSDTYEMIRQP